MTEFYGERSKKRLEATLRRQYALQRNLLTSLGTVEQVLTESVPDIDKAVSILDMVRSQLGAAVGHVKEAREEVEDDTSPYDMANLVTPFIAERAAFESDDKIIAEVLRGVWDDAFKKAYAQLTKDEKLRLLKIQLNEAKAELFDYLVAFITSAGED